MPKRTRTKKRSRPSQSKAPEEYNLKALLTIFAVAMLFYSLLVTSRYMSLSTSIKTPVIMHPLAKFVVGGAQADVAGMIPIPLNQTFCPQNNTVNKTAAAENSYLYYTTATTSQDFRYSLIYNGSTRKFAYATVLPPFKLVSFTNIIQTRQDCVGYPAALSNATLIIQAPNAPYFGPVYAVLYFSNQS